MLHHLGNVSLRSLTLIDGCLDASHQIRGREWLRKIAIYSLFESLQLVFHTRFCREDDDRYMRDGTVLLDFTYHRDTIHHRHGYIGEDEVWHLCAGLIETHLAVFCQKHIILFFEYAAEVQA